jgi:hypothetical protein
MSVNLKLAGEMHDWVMTQGRRCDSPEDVDMAVERFLRRWPRVKSDTLQYVSSMLRAQLHARTTKPAEIMKGVRKRITDTPVVRRRWWEIGRRAFAAD